MMPPVISYKRIDRPDRRCRQILAEVHRERIHHTGSCAAGRRQTHYGRHYRGHLVDYIHGQQVLTPRPRPSRTGSALQLDHRPPGPVRISIVPQPVAGHMGIVIAARLTRGPVGIVNRFAAGPLPAALGLLIRQADPRGKSAEHLGHKRLLGRIINRHQMTAQRLRIGLGISPGQRPIGQCIPVSPIAPKRGHLPIVGAISTNRGQKMTVQQITVFIGHHRTAAIQQTHPRQQRAARRQRHTQLHHVARVDRAPAKHVRILSGHERAGHRGTLMGAGCLQHQRIGTADRVVGILGIGLQLNAPGQIHPQLIAARC